MEKIQSAAIKYKRKNQKTYSYAFGKSHAQCIMEFVSLNLPVSKRDMNFERQGFWTTENRFVDRFEAKEIALKAKQIPDTYDKGELYSEFINWEV